MSGQPARTFFVESYVPRLDRRTADALSSRLREHVRQLNEEGMPVRWCGSFALVDEETYIYIVAAPAMEDVVGVSARLGLVHDHIAEVLAIQAPVTCE